MPQLMESALKEHILRADIVQTEIVKSECFIIVDSNGNPVVELRADDDKTLQIMDKYGNIRTEIRIG